MIRDFKRFAGQQPQAFYRSLNGLSAAMISAETETGLARDAAARGTGGLRV